LNLVISAMTPASLRMTSSLTQSETRWEGYAASLSAPADTLLSGETGAAGGPARWQEPLAHLWGRRAWQRVCDGDPAQAGLAIRLPLRQATAVIESITADEDLVSVQLYGHPWVTGEYWPMITPCFHVRAVDDMGGEYDGISGRLGSLSWIPRPAERQPGLDLGR
jgi:hypothetical protein